LIFRDTNYKRSAHWEHDSASIESQVLQQCKSRSEIRRQFVASSVFVPPFGAENRSIMFRQAGLPVPLEGVDRVQSACNMPYDDAARAAGTPDAREEDRNGYLG
jgi:hypothetical protein